VYPAALGEDAPAEFRYNGCIIKQNQYSTLTPSWNNRMEEKRLPKVQILFAFLFGLVVLLAPAFIRSIEAILFLAAGSGLALAVATARIGWAVLRQGKTVVYPFQAWSLALLKRIYGAQAVRELEQKKPQATAQGQKWLGIASLAGGGLAAGAALLAILYALSQIV
jgi:hypothetical protein